MGKTTGNPLLANALKPRQLPRNESEEQSEANGRVPSSLETFLVDFKNV